MDPAVTQHGGPTSCGLGVRQAFCPFLRGGHPVRCELWEAGSWESWRSVCCRGSARNHTAQPGLHVSSCVFCPLVRGEVRHTLKGWTVRCDGRWAQGGAGVGVYHTPRGLTTVFWTDRMVAGGGGGTEASSMLKVQEDRPGRRQHAVTGPVIGVRRVFLPHRAI